MILEVAMLDVRPGEEAAFEAAFAEASTFISSMPGYIRHSLQRRIEPPVRYLLLVEWETLEDHTVGFRGSPEYQRWKELLHHFYDPFPVVEHFEPRLVGEQHDWSEERIKAPKWLPTWTVLLSGLVQAYQQRRRHG